MTADIRAALRRAYSLGQTYWEQADSESYKQNRLSFDTQKKFEALVDETCAALAEAAAAAPAAEVDKARLDSGCIFILSRDEFGEPQTIEHRGIDLRAAIDDAIRRVCFSAPSGTTPTS